MRNPNRRKRGGLIPERCVPGTYSRGKCFLCGERVGKRRSEIPRCPGFAVMEGFWKTKAEFGTIMLYYAVHSGSKRVSLVVLEAACLACRRVVPRLDVSLASNAAVKC